MIEINYPAIIDLLMERMPELRERYQEERQWWGEERPGPHVVYGDLFSPFISQLLDSDADRLARQRAFDLLEVLSSSQDEKVREVVGATVLPNLRAEEGKLELARRHMGPATLVLADAMASWKPDPS